MEKRPSPNDEPEPTGPEGVPLDAPDNTAPAISPHAVSRAHRAENDDEARKRSIDFSDAYQTPDDRSQGRRDTDQRKP